ncbi:MAG TPA: FeoA family protein [Anaerovoracaceae bacterium]|nr:FeoA family protein [Anaerovoracaceae bacterium]
MQKKCLPLNSLCLGQKGVVVDIFAPEAEKRRFWDLGLIRGITIESLHKSPSGDPIAYSIMGAVIALRNNDAEKVSVIKCENISPECLYDY